MSPKQQPFGIIVGEALWSSQESREKDISYIAVYPSVESFRLVTSPSACVRRPLAFNSKFGRCRLLSPDLAQTGALPHETTPKFATSNTIGTLQSTQNVNVLNRTNQQIVINQPWATRRIKRRRLRRMQQVQRQEQSRTRRIPNQHLMTRKRKLRRWKGRAIQGITK